MSTTYLLVANLRIPEDLYELWLAAPLDEVGVHAGGWMEHDADAPLRESTEEALAAVADAADHFSFVRAGDSLAVRIAFSNDVLVEDGPSLSRLLQALPALGGSGTVVLVDLGTRRGSVATITARRVKVGATKPDAMTIAAIQDALSTPRVRPTDLGGPAKAKATKKPAKASTKVAKASKKPAKASTKVAKASK